MTLGPILADLRKSAKKADKIYLATDPDREGEAIAWHLANSLNLEGKFTESHLMKLQNQQCRLPLRMQDN